MTTPPRRFRLGALPSDLTQAPRLEDYLTGAHLPPSGVNVDRATKVTSWPMYLNDQLGDCTIAAAGHMFAGMAVYAGYPEPVFADAEILKAYSAVSGYNPVNGDDDNGAQPVDVLNYLNKTGLTDQTGKTHKVAAWAAIRYVDSPGLATQVLNTFGSVYWAINCPESAQTQFTGPGSLWTYDASSPIEGGHAIVLQRRRDQVPGIFSPVTWGALIQEELGFFLHYTTEAFAVVSEDWIAANGDTIEGLDLAQLVTDTAAVK